MHRCYAHPGYVCILYHNSSIIIAARRRPLTIRHNALWLCKNHCCENMASSLPQSCAVVTAPLEVSHSGGQRSQFVSKSPADLRSGRRSSKIWLSSMEHPEYALVESESTLLSSRGVWERLEVLRSTGDVARHVWEDCVWLPDRCTFCWCT